MVQSDNVVPMELEVPISACVVSDLLALPYHTDDHFEWLVNTARQGGALPFPVVRPLESRFEVIWGWDVIMASKAVNSERVRVLNAAYSDLQTLEFAITRHTQDLNLHRLDLADALKNAKKKLGLSDQELSDATGIERSLCTRYIKISTKLAPSLALLVRVGRINFTALRKLVTLPISGQEALAKEFQAKNWDQGQLLSIAFPGQDKKPKHQDVLMVTESSPAVEKSNDIKKLEVTLSERVGYPISIEPTSGDPQGGEIHCQFFSRSDMIDALSRIRAGFRRHANVRGKFVLKYDSLDDFDNLTGDFFTEEF